MSKPAVPPEFDLALIVTVPETEAEVFGALLMERLGPFELREASPGCVGPKGAVAIEASGSGSESASKISLVFYPPQGAVSSARELVASLPPGLVAEETLEVELRRVPRDWVEGWREHFRPLTVGRVRVRPPWLSDQTRSDSVQGGGQGEAGSEPAGRDSRERDFERSDPAPLAGRSAPFEVVINPGLGFGTGLHPTTRGTLRFLQTDDEEQSTGRNPGALVDVGTGSGILAIAAAKMGFAPVIAFDSDSVALASARENLELNGVAGQVHLYHQQVEAAPKDWFVEATVLANLTLEPVLELLGRLAQFFGAANTNEVSVDGRKGESVAERRGSAGRGGPSGGERGRPRRLVVSGILSGAQEDEVLRAAWVLGYGARRRLYEAEWVTLELVPQSGAQGGDYQRRGGK